MTTARQAYEDGGERGLEATYEGWTIDYAEAGASNAEDEWAAEASAVVHNVPKKAFKTFWAAMAYGLWEEWGSIEPPFPCPAALIEGYAAEEELVYREIQDEVVDKTALEGIKIIGPSRVFERRLTTLAPPEDPTQPARVRWAIRHLAVDLGLGELHARYGIATGIATRFLGGVFQPRVTPETRFRPIPVRDALDDWAAEPFWVDIVKVGRMPENEFRDLLPSGQHPTVLVLRDGTERDHHITLFHCEGDAALVAAVFRKRQKRFSGQTTEIMDAPPVTHLWAFSQLGVRELGLGDAQCDLRYMMGNDELQAIHREMVDLVHGKVVPRQSQ